MLTRKRHTSIPTSLHTPRLHTFVHTRGYTHYIPARSHTSTPPYLHVGTSAYTSTHLHTQHASTHPYLHALHSHLDIHDYTPTYLRACIPPYLHINTSAIQPYTPTHLHTSPSPRANELSIPTPGYTRTHCTPLHLHTHL